MNTKGLQLSINFLVMLIIAITIFGFGIYLVQQFFGFAEQTQASVDLQAQQEIERRLFRGGEPAAIPLQKAKIRIGESHAFGLGIMNIYDSTKDLEVEVAYDQAFTPDGQQASGDIQDERAYIEEHWLFEDYGTFTLKPNEHEIVPVTVQVDAKVAPTKSTIKGNSYVFNVCVHEPGVQINCADPEMENIRGLHGQRVLKLYVEVD